MKNSYLLLAAFLVCFTLVSCNNATSPNNNNNNNNSTDSSSIFHNISGSITLSMRITGSRSTSLGTYDYNKSEDATVNLSFTLQSNPIQSISGGGSSSQWQTPIFGGLVNWTEILLTTYDCNGGRATDKETYIKSFSSAASGNQPGGVQITIKGDGSYGINATPGYTGMPTNVTHTIETNCGTPTNTTNQGSGPGIPFSQYFTPFTNGAMGSFTGTIDKSNQSHITGTFNGTDNMTIFDYGTTPVLMPIAYTVTWDLTRTK